MDAEPAASGRYFRFSGTSELASAADRVDHLPIHAYVPGSRSHFVAGYGERAVADDAD